MKYGESFFNCGRILGPGVQPFPRYIRREERFRGGVKGAGRGSELAVRRDGFFLGRLRSVEKAIRANYREAIRAVFTSVEMEIMMRVIPKKRGRKERGEGRGNGTYGNRRGEED